jgi:hypothetical protein
MRANTALSSNPSASNIGGTLRPVTAGTNLLVFIMVSQVYYYRRPWDWTRRISTPPSQNRDRRGPRLRRAASMIADITVIGLETLKFLIPF